MAEPHATPTPNLRRATSALSQSLALYSFSDTYKPTLCYGLIYIDDGMQINELRTMAAERMLPVFPRLRSKLFKDKSGKIFFEELDLDDIDLTYHVSYLTRDVVSVEGARDLLRPFYKKGLDLDKPLWRMYLVPELDDGRSLIVFQVDHSVGDGSGLREIMYSVADPIDDTFIKNLMARPLKRKQGRPMAPLRVFYNYVYGVFQGLTSLLDPEDSPNRLKVEDIYNSSDDRRMAATGALSMDDVRKVKSSFQDGTVNDVAMTVYTLMIQQYLAENGDEITGDELIRACFPIDLRDPRDKITHVGNNFSFGKYKLALTQEDRIKTFWKVKQAMDNLKAQPTPLILSFLAEHVLPLFPATWQLHIGVNTLAKFSGMISNVFGPTVQVTLLGRKVDNIEIYLHSEMGSYFGIFSYNNRLTGTVTLDGTREADPNKLTKHWQTEFDALMKEVEAEKAKQGVDVLMPPNVRFTNFVDNPDSIYIVYFLLAVFVAMYLF